MSEAINTIRKKPILRLDRIYKKFSSDRYALRAVNLKVYPGEIVALTGENGSGKSTLLKIAAGVLPQDTGTVKFEGKEIESPLSRLIPGHPEILFLHQETRLDKNIPVEEMLHRAIPGLRESDKKNRILLLLKSFNIEKLRRKKATELSGGEQQRVGWARAFARSPKLFLLDEPFSNIDYFTARQLKEQVFSMIRQEGSTAVFVTHSPDEAQIYANETLLMKKGRIIARGPAKDIFETH